MEDRKQDVDGCCQPPALDDLALIAAIDGEASPEVMAHLRTCVSCAARAQHFATLQGLLRERFFRMFCPTTDELIAFHNGMVVGEQQEAIAAHILDCPHCQRELHLLKQITSERITGRSPPFFWKTLDATATPQSHIPAHKPALTQLRRVVAEELRFDLPRALAEAYGAPRGPGRTDQYAYQAENLQVTINVHRLVNRADRRVLTGTLYLDDDLPQGACQASAYLAHNNQLIRTTDLDELGNFMLDDLSPGNYRLSLRLPDREVVIETISL
jgi:hypothetical protein